MQFRRLRQWQPRQERDVDTTKILAFNQNCGQVTRVGEVLSTKPVENSCVFDFLKGDYIGAAAVIDLSNRIGKHA